MSWEKAEYFKGKLGQEKKALMHTALTGAKRPKRKENNSMINFKGKEYTPEEILALPEAEQRKMLKGLQAAGNNHPNPVEDDEILTNDDYLKEEDDIPVIEIHEIKNPKAAKFYEQLLASGTDHEQALIQVQDKFDLEEEDIDDPTWNKLVDEIEKRNDYPTGLKWKILSYAITRGLDLNTAISEVSINSTRHYVKKNAEPKTEPDNETLRAEAILSQNKRMGIDKLKERLEKRRR